MNRRVENWIPAAIQAAETHLAKNGVIKKEYNGYISSFGAAVLHSGLKAAIAFNESASSGSKEERGPLMLALLQIVTDQQIDNNSDEKLLKYVLDNDTADTKEKILDAATALKLAIRTFKLSKEEEA